MNEALNEAYYGSYGSKVNPGVGGRKNSNYQLSFAQDKLPFAQVVERQYLDSFIASSPKPIKHPMQVLSPSEESNRSHKNDSPRIKDDINYAKGGPNYITEDSAQLTMSRGGQRKEREDTHAHLLHSKLPDQIYNQPHNAATSIPLPLADKITV